MSRKMKSDSGVEKIAAERRKQIEMGFSVTDDLKMNSRGELIEAANAMLVEVFYDRAEVLSRKPRGWDTERWIRMCSKSYPERLAIAGALIAAELDRQNLSEYVEHEFVASHDFDAEEAAEVTQQA